MTKPRHAAPEAPDGEQVDPLAVVVDDVAGVLAKALDHIDQRGWRRKAPGRGRAGGARLVDALNIASAHAKVDRDTHLLVFACTAMAIEPHVGVAAHDLLPDACADEYLSPDTDPERLHLLDAAIVNTYNADHCGGARDAVELLRVAHDRAPEIIAAQLAAQGAGA